MNNVMREIKFRAWDSRTGKWYASAFGPFEWMYQNTDWGAGKNPAYTVTMPPEGVILNQYTGLKDKNGKEIWEGDVVRIQFPSNPNGTDEITVATIIETFRGLQFLGHGSSTEVRVKNPECLEIIGNIYENPELLTNS